MNSKTINLIITILILTCITTLGGCNSSQEESYKAYNSDEELEGTLSVTTYYDGYINILADEFMKIHPNVDIQVIYSDSNEFETLEGYARRLSVELMNGESTDLIDLAWLDLDRYGKSGLLCDLYKFMESDADFNKEDYYSNIFEGMEFDGGLYAMPFTFLYDLVNMSKPIAESLELDLSNFDEINYIEMLDIFETAKKQHESPETFNLMPGAVKEIFFDDEITEYYNTKTGEVRINSNEFIKHLNLTKSIPTEYSPNHPGGWKMNRVYDGEDSFMKSDFMFTRYSSNAIDLYNLMIEYENIFSSPVPFVNEAGNSPFRTCSSTYAIPLSSENKELAWEFLKYSVSEKELPKFENEEEELKYFTMYGGWIPINIENFYTSFRHNFEKEIKRIKEANFDVIWKSENKDEMITETIDEIHKFNLDGNKLNNQTELWQLVRQDLENFYYFDLATAEETADIIHNKVLTYNTE